MDPSYQAQGVRELTAHELRAASGGTVYPGVSGMVGAVGAGAAAGAAAGACLGPAGAAVGSVLGAAAGAATWWVEQRSAAL